VEYPFRRRIGKDKEREKMRIYRNAIWLTFIFFLFSFLAFIVIVEDMHDTSLGSDRMIDDDSITGDVVNTYVNLIPTISKNCSFDLYPGWNMVSFYCLGLFANRTAVLQPLDGAYGAIFKYQANDVSDPWKSYNPYLPLWVTQQLNYMDRVSGYWIYMYNQTNFLYSGIYSDSRIDIYSGWNLIGYPNTNNSYVNDSLKDIPFTIVKHYDKGTAFDNETNETYYIGVDVWLVYVNGSSNNTLEQLETYKGYWVNVTEDSQWVISRG
jgi:hypothetical protein